MSLIELTPTQRESLASSLAAALAADTINAPAQAGEAGLISISLELEARQDDWLRRWPAQARFDYWAEPGNGVYLLGIGAAITLESAGPGRFSALQSAWRGLLADWHFSRNAPLPRAHLGFAFSETETGPLANMRLTVPAIQLVSAAGRRHAIFSVPRRQAAQASAVWERLLKAQPAASWPALRSVESALCARAWMARAEAALSAIGTGTLDKVVLARELPLQATRPPPIPPMLARLNAQQPESRIFAHGTDATVFLGAAPERLLSLRSGHIVADALAGTSSRAADAGQQLYDDPKSRHEQALVTGAIVAALTPIAHDLHHPQQPQVVHRGPLSHLWTPVHGTLNPGADLFDLAARLHPTPAVGGTPAAAALAWLEQHGERRSGWYSGGIGWMTPDGDGEISVALRCGLIEGQRIRLQAGAGLVAGSQPASELEEIRAKFTVMLNALSMTVESRSPRTGTEHH